MYARWEQRRRKTTSCFITPISNFVRMSRIHTYYVYAAERPVNSILLQLAAHSAPTTVVMPPHAVALLLYATPRLFL